MKFKMKVGNIEARSCDENLLSSKEHITIEIIKWFEVDKRCLTIAYWTKSKEGYNLKFVGNRPFEVEPTLFFKMTKSAQEYLDKEFEREE